MNQKRVVWIPTWVGLLVMMVVAWGLYRYFVGADSSNETAAPTASVQNEKQRQLLWIEKSKDAVRATLKDPESAQFRNVFFHRTAEGLPMVCGEVNARNGLGGYGGFKSFVSAGSPATTFLQEQMDPVEFAKLRLQLCA